MKRSSPLRRTPLRRVSKKRAKQLREYSEARKVFLEAHPICEVWLAEKGWAPKGDGYTKQVMSTIAGGMVPLWATAQYLLTQEHAPASVEVHHKAGRTGPNFLDQSTWMAVSQEAHRRIHDRPGEARKKGWITT